MENAVAITNPTTDKQPVYTENAHRKRGKFLTIILLISLISVLWELQSSSGVVFRLIINPLQLHLWNFLIEIGVYIFEIASLWAIFVLWRWKKYGLYLFIVSTILTLVFNIPGLIQVFKSPEAVQLGIEGQIIVGVIAAILEISLFSLMIWSVRRKWSYFC